MLVCHDKRIYDHKVFNGLTAKAHYSINWFYGFKLHLITSERGIVHRSQAKFFNNIFSE